MPERRELLDAFVRASGWGDARRVAIAGDASRRRYERLTDASGKTAILMDADPTSGEDVRPFLEITEMLRQCGLSAPEVYAQDESVGLLLLEDLGDNLFARVISADPSAEQPLYQAATDLLIHLHGLPVPSLPLFDAKVMTDASGLVFDWYQLGALGTVDTQAKLGFLAALSDALRPLDRARWVPILRDFHAENLIWMPERTGVTRVGLLDYQDAKRGHSAYDLVSMLQDVRRDVSYDVAAEMVNRYVQKTGAEPDEFRTAFALLGTQRNLRILGIFARLCLADGKPDYIDLIPRVWAHIETNLSHSSLRRLAPYVHEVLPAPTPDILNILKDKCATKPQP